MSVAFRAFNARVFLLSGLATAFCLIDGMLLGGVLGAIVNERLPGHQTDVVNIILSAIPAFGGVIAGGAAWGWAISRITLAGNGARMAWAGAIGFGPTAILVALALTFFENLIVEQHQGPQLPIHNVFTMLFVPAAMIVAGIGGLAIGIGARLKQPTRLAMMSALGGGIAFLAVNLLMDTLGWRVGAPGAAERATMLTTFFSGSFAAAVVGGGGIVVMLGSKR